MQPSVPVEEVRQPAANVPLVMTLDPALTWEVPPPLPLQWGNDFLSTHVAGEQSPSAAGVPPDVADGGYQDAPLHPVVADVLRGLSVASQEHLHLMIGQLLVAEDVDDIPTWLPIIRRLAVDAAESLSPKAISARGVMDPHHYIHVKKVADFSDPSTSRVIQGVVFSKNVAHRKMRTAIAQPKVLMLQGSLEYHRERNRLLSFDMLLDQEKEHIRTSVKKVTKFSPDVLLVENTVSRIAQSMLLLGEPPVTFVLNVKRAVLERIARCNEVELAPNLDSLSNKNVANCESFRLEVTLLRPSVTTPDDGSDPMRPSPSPKQHTLMILEGMKKGLGCTVLLRGATLVQLVKLKRIVRFAVCAAYSARLETSYFVDVCTANRGKAMSRCTLMYKCSSINRTSWLPRIRPANRESGLKRAMSVE